MRVIGVLFGLIFFCIGSFFLYKFSLSPALDAYQMRNWNPHYAELLSITDGNNYTEAQYRYYINNQYYENNRVYLADFSDNIGNYHYKLYKRLSYLKNKNETVKIWVNPTNPQSSIIDKNIRWGLFLLTFIFCSVFILIGSIVIYASFTSDKTKKFKKPKLSELRKEWDKKVNEDENYELSFLEFARQREAELEEEFHITENKNIDPNTWKEKKEWKNNRIRSNAKSGVIGIWCFAIFWSALSSTVLFAIEEELNKGNYAILIALLFPIVGLGMIIYAIKLTREWLRFGVIELELDPFPGSIGGHVGGNFFLKNNKIINEEFNVELQCVYTYMSGSGDNRRRHESVKWHESGLAKTLMLGDGLDIRFRFDVPLDLPEADIEQTDNYHFWRIKLTSETNIGKLDREYNIPVFQTETLSRNIRHNVSEQFKEAKLEETEELKTLFSLGELNKTELRKVLHFSDLGNEVRFYYPMFRNKIFTVFAAIFGIAFSFATVMMNKSFGDSSIMSFVIIVFSIPFALVGIIGIFAMLYLPFNSLTVSIKQRHLRSVRRWFFLPIRIKTIAYEDIQKMEIKSSGSTGEGSSKIEHFKIHAFIQNNKRITVAEGINGKELALQFKDYIYNKINTSY